MSRKLRDFNLQEKEGFTNLFTSIEYKTNAMYESIASKFYRHEYCLVGHDLKEEVLQWFENCGLNVKVTNEDWLQTTIELV